MVEFFFEERWLGCFGNLDLDGSSSSFGSLLLCKSCLLRLDCFFLSCDLLNSGRLRVCPDDLVRQAFQLDLFDAHLGAVFKVKPELSVADLPLLHESFRGIILMRNWLTCLDCNRCLLHLVVGLVALSETKFEVVLGDDGLRKSFASNCEVVHPHNRVVVWVEKCGFLGDVLDLVVFDVQHVLWQEFFIHRVLHDVDCEGSHLSVLCGLWSSSLFGILACGLGLHGFRVGDRHSDLLLEHDLIGEEGDPVLEVWHDSVSGAPGTLTVRLVKVDRSCGLSLASWHLLVGLVVEGNEKSVLARIVQTGHVWFVKQGLREHLSEYLRREVVFVGSVEDFVFLGAFFGLESLVNEVLLDQLLELFEEEHALGIRDR